ncbi:hypothetical protein [Paenibacillus piscarius]|uniref:hypothetical protein n=1 Tax=Paenibacillus piscarius TaxID=1089681 RepID=UPI001EE975B8|nr:hypothetical protein [Paenibacillus piscarius]
MSFLPSARSGRWLAWGAGYALILWLLLILHRFVLLGDEFNLTLCVRWAILSLIFSAIVNGFGWLGARLLWVITTAGIVVGLCFMYLTTYRDMSGWEDLAGFLAFWVYSLGGLALGLIAEGIRLLVLYMRRR